MTVSIHQPNFLPWLGYFYKIYKSDLHIFLDDTQFSNSGMHDFTYIKISEKSTKLKIPTQYKFGDDIKNVQLKQSAQWQDSIIKSIHNGYSKSKYYNIIIDDLTRLFNSNTQNLSDFNINLIVFFAEKFGFKTKFINSSVYNINTKRQDKIIDLCKITNAQNYLSGVGAKNYQEESTFTSHGINLVYNNYLSFKYNQIGDNFIEGLSILDFIMNNGYDWGLVIKNQNI